MKYFLGIDIGSTSSKGVVINPESVILSSHTICTKPKHSDGVKIILDLIGQDIKNSLGQEFCREDFFCVGTGYGRSNVYCADKIITEITCHAKGAHYFYPNVKTVIDIGGQDSKVIGVNENGEVLDFVMNEKCAAGTGRFLDAASKILHVPVEELGDKTLEAKSICKINSTCVVYAKSEILLKIAEGEDKESIIKGMHAALAARTLNMGKRVGIKSPIVFTGGVAKNKGMVEALIELTGFQRNEIIIPSDPQIVGAFGAALFAREESGK
jgi:predicted CoA-substrate-specific enzyme activase